VMAANKHVPLIEQQIRVIKECIHATRHSLPFKAIPLLMLIKMVHTYVKWINAFPLKGGMSRMMSPRTIMTGTQPNYKSDCRLAFGAYVQAHQEPSPSNSQEACTVSAICLGPSGNIQGSFEFLNLTTSRKIMHRSWNALPKPQEVINRVNQLGKADSQPSVLSFSDSQGNPVGELQALIDPPNQTEIPGVQLDPPLTTKMPEESAPQESTIQVDPHENFPEPVLNMEDDNINPPVAPEPIEVENPTKPLMEGTAVVPKIPDPEPD